MGYDVPGPNSEPSDVELIEACVEFERISQQANEIEDDLNHPIYADMDAALARMCQIRATSPAGVKARAATFARYSPGLLNASRGDYSDRMAGALLRDILT